MMIFWQHDQRKPVLLIFLLIIVLLLFGCAGREEGGTGGVVVPNGDPERGRAALETYGCGACHTIPGVRDADALVGPPLDYWSERTYIAGRLNNTPAELVAWIQDPQRFEPGTAMPDMHVSEQDARDMAAYLYTLRRDEAER